MVRASLIWLNYNSSGFIDIALRSIESALRLDFDDYEVVIVDNASKDGSFERIRKFVEERKPGNVRVKFVRSDANRGYAGGMNLGWEAKDSEAKYVAFLNNDLILQPNSLRELVDYMEGDEKLVAANGLIYHGNSERIYTAGGYGTDHWIFGDICRGIFEYECPGVNKSHYVTFASGAYMITNSEIVRKVSPEGKPFIDETFLYLDDVLLGLILWNKGYRVAYVPVPSGYHYGSLSTRHVVNYYSRRARTALIRLLNTRFSWIKEIYLIRLSIGYKLLDLLSKNGKAYKAYQDGIYLAQILRNKLGFILNLHKAPYVRVSYLNFTLLDFMMIDRILHRTLTVTHEMLINLPWL